VSASNAFVFYVILSFNHRKCSGDCSARIPIFEYFHDCLPLQATRCSTARALTRLSPSCSVCALRSAVSDVTSTILPRPAMLPAQAAPPQTLPLRSVCPARVQRHPLAIAAQISALSADRRDFESPATSQRSRSTSSQTPSSSPDRSLQVAENATSSANDRLHAERRRCARPRCCGSPVRRGPGHRGPHSLGSD
jgi:hypothetical protein